MSLDLRLAALATAIGEDMAQRPAFSTMPHLGSPTAEAVRDALVAAGLMAAAGPTPPSVISAPVASGANYIGDTATATTGSWSGSPTSYSYQWQQFSSNTWQNMPDATSATLEFEAAGQYRVGVAATNAVGTSSTSYSNALTITAAPQEPSNIVLPSISGATTEGATLTANPGTWTDAPTGYGYQWEIWDGDDWADIPGATGTTITAGAPGTRYRVTVVASNAVGDSAPATSPERQVTGPVPVIVMNPSLNGNPVVGTELSVNFGEWNEVPDSFTYQWQRWTGTAWANIGGATSSTFTATEVMRVRALVTAHNVWGASEPAASSFVDITQPSSGELTWAGGYRTSRDGNYSTSTATTQYGQSYSTPLPAAGNIYFELQVNESQPQNRVGIWPFEGEAPGDPGIWGDLGQGALSHCVGLAADGEWSNHLFFNATWVDTNEPNTSMEPARRWAFHLQDRSLRIWQVWPGGQSAAYNSGNPVAVFPGTTPLHVGHSAGPGLGALIVPVEDHWGTPPEGSTPV